MKERSFLDTNILLYTDDSKAPEKQAQALALLKSGWQTGNAVISTQVLQEYFAAATRKLETARRKIELLSARADVFSIAPDDIVQAIDLHRLHSFSFWDSLIVRMAQKSACTVLFSEDMQDGRVIGNVRIVNPFA
jgi:predicted nucleic acid-binding protein